MFFVWSLFLGFLALQLAGFAHWSWSWITSPLWSLIAIMTAVASVAGCVIAWKRKPIAGMILAGLILLPAGEAAMWGYYSDGMAPKAFLPVAGRYVWGGVWHPSEHQSDLPSVIRAARRQPA
jgi:hypothetical protein